MIINPNSPTAFDPVFRHAKKKGILVVSTDAEVSSQDAIYVGIDQKGWAMQSAQWLADTLGGKGNVVAISGWTIRTGMRPASRAAANPFLIGSNGSGKSTLCKIIGGSVIPDAGRLQIAGRAVAINGPRDAERAGIRVFYMEEFGRQIVFGMTLLVLMLFCGRQQRLRI